MAFEVVPCALGGPIDEVQEQVFEDDYEMKHGEGSGYVELALRAVDSATGKMLGACTAEYWYGGLVITRLVVEPGSRRRRGIGSALLLAMLEAGAAKGSLVATVQTFAHQAPDWYPRFGFKELFRRHGYGAARTFYYFVRQYSPGEAFPRPPSLEPSIRIETVDGGHTPEVLAFCRANFDQHGMEALGDTARVSRFAFAALPPELAAEARRAVAAATEASSAAAAPAPSACASDTVAAASDTVAAASSVAAASGGLSSATAAPAAPAPTLCPLPPAKKILGTIEGLAFWGGLQVSCLPVVVEMRRLSCPSSLQVNQTVCSALPCSPTVLDYASVCAPFTSPLPYSAGQIPGREGGGSRQRHRRRSARCCRGRGGEAGLQSHCSRDHVLPGAWPCFISSRQDKTQGPSCRLKAGLMMTTSMLIFHAGGLFTFRSCSDSLSIVQVPDFYAARGYRLDGTAGGWKGGAAMHYFSKLLRPESLHSGPFVEPAEPIILPAGVVAAESAGAALGGAASQ